MKKITIKIRTSLKAGIKDRPPILLYGIQPLYGIYPLYGVEPAK